MKSETILSGDQEPFSEENAILVFKNVSKVFKSGHVVNYALDGVNLSLKEGESISIVGESGSGKTTLGLTAVKLLQPTKGSIKFEGAEVGRIRGNKLREFRRNTQMIFQDPYSSINPYDTIYSAVAMPLLINKKPVEEKEGIKLTNGEIRKRVSRMLDKVGLSPGDSFLDLFPKKLSGGQRQRVAVARALILNPKFIVADEPTSMLDVSISAQVLNLLSDLKKEFNFSMIYISHELATARYISEKMAVMNLGRIVEYGTSEAVTAKPRHPYADILIRSVPELEGLASTERKSKIDYNAYNGGIKGCSFAHSCPFKTDRCESERPELTEIESGHYVACFHPV